MEISPQTRFFFPEIDGVGVSALARYLSLWGASVSGSVQRDSLVARRLVEAGISVEVGGGPEQVQGADVVVRGGEVLGVHGQVVAAEEEGIPVVSPGAVMGALLKGKRVIGVTGTHGKGSVASMIAWILERAGANPGFIIGGELKNFGENARLGGGDLLVVELSEDDPALHAVHCDYGVCNFLELEHLHQKGEPERLMGTLRRFLEGNERLKEAFINLDCLGNRRLVERLELRPTGYSLGFQSEFRGVFEGQDEPPFVFQAYHRAELIGEFELEIPGEYQVTNALGAIALAWRLGLDPSVIKSALKSYRGHKDRYALASGGGVKILKVATNYPRGIAKALAGVDLDVEGRTVVVLRPDELVSLEDFHQQYARALKGVDAVILSSLPEAADLERVQRSLRLLAGTIEAEGAEATFLTQKRALEELLPRQVKPGDQIIFFGDQGLMEQADGVQAQLAEREAKSPPAEGQPPLDGPLTEGE